jgi:hypothetical protein
MDSMQLLYYQAPLSAFLLMLVIPFYEPIFHSNGLFNGDWDAIDLVKLRTIRYSTQQQHALHFSFVERRL